METDCSPADIVNQFLRKLYGATPWLYFSVPARLGCDCGQNYYTEQLLVRALLKGHVQPMPFLDPPLMHTTWR